MAKEYAFDIKLQTVARVTADSEDAARAAIRSELDALDIGTEVTAENGAIIKLTEASVCGSSGYLFEVGGAPVNGDADEDDPTPSRTCPANSITRRYSQ